jgi:photosystem II stability/assembly factor-like uncharacterized protein
MLRLNFVRFVICSIFLLAVLGCGVPAGDSGPVPPADASSGPGWRVLGPGGGGAQYLSTINPADPNHVFVRCDMTGAYVTRDGGASWKMFNLRTVVQDFEFDPTDPATVYASNSGLYRSVDGGAAWELIYPAPEDIAQEMMVGDHANHSFMTKDGQNFGSIQKVRVDPADGNRIFIGKRPQRVFSAAAAPREAGSSSAILYSNDRGASWNKLAEVPGRQVLAIFPGSWRNQPDLVAVFTDQSASILSLSGEKIRDIPLPVERITAAEAGINASGEAVYVLSPMAKTGTGVSGGVYRTIDGQNWTQVNSGLLDDYEATGRLPTFRAFAACEGDPSVVYLGVLNYYAAKAGGETERQYGTFKTEDGGQSWKWVYRANNEKMIVDNHTGSWMKKYYGPEWGEYPMSIGVSSTNPDVVWTNDLGCTYRSLDGGATWEQKYSDEQPDGSYTSRGLDVTTNYGIHFDPFDPKHIFVTYTDIGAFHSFNGGESWVHAINGISGRWDNTCYWMVFDPEVKGRAWSVWGSGHDLPRPKMFRSGNFGRYVGGVAVSDDAARSWSQSSRGMPPNSVTTHIELDPDSPADARTLYVCVWDKGVFKSEDGGRNWTLKNKGLGRNLNAWRITRVPDGKLYLLVGRGLEGGKMLDGQLYTSTDGAESWQLQKLPAGANAPNDLIFDPTAPERMYLSLWPFTVDGTERHGGLLRTEDGGASWTRIFDEDAHVYAAALDPDNTATIVINTFDSAAFRSDDRGSSWSRIEGYNFKWGHRPVFDIHNKGMLYLTTFGGSVYYGPATGVPGDKENFTDRSWQKWTGKY